MSVEIIGQDKLISKYFCRQNCKRFSLQLFHVLGEIYAIRAIYLLGVISYAEMSNL